MLEDITILPYYIHNKRIMELYDYELNIRLVDSPDVDRSILKRTGKLSIDEIDTRVLSKLQNCYF